MSVPRINPQSAFTNPKFVLAGMTRVDSQIS
jgi:hypothetical protein